MHRASTRGASPAVMISVVALVAALGGGAYAAIGGIPDSQAVFHGCVNTRSGALRVVKRAGNCHGGHTVAIAWNQHGPQGPAGVAGPQGPSGPPGATGPAGTTDTSQFYTKAESDARFVQGSGVLTRIAPLTTTDGATNVLADVAGMGKLEVECALVNTAVKYTNESGVTQRYVLASGLTAHNNANGAPDTGTLSAAANFQNVSFNSNDVVRLSLTDGTKFVDFTMTFVRDASSNCVDWGEVHTG